MTAKQINTALWITAVAAMVLGVGGLMLSFMLPMVTVRSSDAAHLKQAAAPTAHSNSLPPLSAFEKIWATPLRQQLGDPLPVVAETVSPPVVVVPVNPVITSATGDASGLPVSLVGTIGESLALLKTVTNSVEVCEVGDSFAGVTVVAVRQSEADVKFNGRVVKLARPPDRDK